jgi:myo-inositol-1(or 4)-monophosphatase
MAGMICVLEAGGTITDYSGGTKNLNGSQLVVSNGHIHAQMLDVIANS